MAENFNNGIFLFESHYEITHGLFLSIGTSIGCLPSHIKTSDITNSNAVFIV